MELHHSSGLKIPSPLHLSEILRLGEAPQQVAQNVQQAIQEEWIKDGNYNFLLDQYQSEDIELGEFTLELTASENKIFPALELKFDWIYFKNEQDYYLGFLPALNLESSGKSFEALTKNLKENVLLEFMRKERLKSLPSLISTQWFENLKLHQMSVDFEFYTLSELDKIKDHQQQDQELLPEVAQRMQTQGSKVLFGLEKEFEQLTDALKGRNPNSVLIVGGVGKGKTALIKEFYEQQAQLKQDEVVIWEISAAQLLHRLSGLGAWEEYLGILCRELRKKRHLLYVPNFAELFEVGQYVGNSLSMGDFLRDFIARGEIILLSECSPEAASSIELRSPGYLNLFTTITLSEQADAQILEIVSQKTQQIGMAKSTLIEENAIQETLRLQKWFTPYSELPGKTINFLHALISDKEKADIKIIDKKSIYERFSQETGMPEFMINPQAALDIEAMYQFFYQNIFGQEEAIETVIDLLIAVKAAVIRRGKPLASLLFVGPTGVGKTEMAKVLAEFMFGTRNKMVRFDMSEYADLQGIMRLTGDGGGEGLLTAAVRQAPFSVLLFDELEKVHPAFYDLLLQILGEGRLTDARGRVADFCSTIIIMTSNIGAGSFQSGSIGFGDPSNLQETASAHFKAQVQAFFRPELFNRLDRIIAFAPLAQDIVRKITNREIRLIKQREGIKNRDLYLEIPKEVLDHLSQVGYDAQYGARFLQRALQAKFVIPLAEVLNQYEPEKTLGIQVRLEDKQLHFEANLDMKNTPTDFYLTQQAQKKQAMHISLAIPYASGLRMMAAIIEEGSYYAKLLSQFDQLERKRKSLEKKKQLQKFWNDETTLKKFYATQKLKDELQTAFQEIKEFEIDLLVAYKFGREQLGKSFDEFKKLGELGEKMEGLKVQLVKSENPQFANCSLGIYSLQGSGTLATLKLAEVYEKIGGQLGFEIEKKKVFRDASNRTFVKVAFYAQNIPEYYELIGVEITFKGDNMPFLYFKGEGGIHNIVSEYGLEQFIFISITHEIAVQKENQPEAPITNTGEEYRVRKNKKKEKPRRFIDQKQFKDTRYTHEESYENLSETLKTLLSSQFEEHINDYLLGEDREKLKPYF